jgi:hypothetical protein
MRVILAVSVLGLLATSPVFAECVTPDNNVVIPNGSTASRDEMLAAQKALKAYDAAVKSFSDCLQTEADAMVKAGGDKAKVTAAYAKRNNTEVDKVKALASRWSTELAAFKAKPAG